MMASLHKFEKIIQYVKFSLILISIRELSMKLETKISSCEAFSREVFCLLSALFFSACTVTPKEFAINPPYYVYDLSNKKDIETQKNKIKMQQFAAPICAHHRKINLNKMRPPNSFTSDGFSMSPDDNWGPCCMEHDISYWCGGTKQDRMDADYKMKQCITKMGYPVYGWIANNLGVQT
jgi:hypothetical protein